MLDIGCGAGRALCELARTYPNSRFTGYDICPPAIEAARNHADKLGLHNVSFEVHDISRLDLRAAFDVVTAFDVIHDQRDPAAVLRGVHQVLRPGGMFLMQDIRAASRVSENMDHPLCPFLYTISTMHCMTVSLAQCGAGLGTAWGTELALHMLVEAGFDDVSVQTLPHDIQNNYYVMNRH